MRASLLAALATGVLLACSGNGNGDGGTINQANPCFDVPPNPPPSDTPSACPSPEPSYQADVLPILESSCLLCHTPMLSDGGVFDGGCFADGGAGDAGYCVTIGPTYPNPQYSSPYNFSTYQLQNQNKGIIFTQLQKCLMPNQDAGAVPLDEAQRETLMDWLVCGAPDN